MHRLRTTSHVSVQGSLSFVLKLASFSNGCCVTCRFCDAHTVTWWAREALLRIAHTSRLMGVSHMWAPARAHDGEPRVLVAIGRATGDVAYNETAWEQSHLARCQTGVGAVFVTDWMERQRRGPGSDTRKCELDSAARKQTCERGHLMTAMGPAEDVLDVGCVIFEQRPGTEEQGDMVCKS